MEEWISRTALPLEESGKSLSVARSADTVLVTLSAHCLKHGPGGHCLCSTAFGHSCGVADEVRTYTRSRFARFLGLVRGFYFRPGGIFAAGFVVPFFFFRRVSLHLLDVFTDTCRTIFRFLFDFTGCNVRLSWLLTDLELVPRRIIPTSRFR